MEYDAVLNKSVAERELKHFSSIVEKHANNTYDVIQTLESNTISCWNAQTDPIKYELNTHEKIPYYQLIQSDNTLVNKVVLALTSICKELQCLTEEAEQDFYSPLFLYKDSVVASKSAEPHSCFVKVLPLLHKIKCYIDQSSKVVSNVILQLNALHTSDSKSVLTVGTAHFQVVFEHLARHLSTLIILDEILSSNSVLLNHWSSYKTLTKSSENDPVLFGTNKQDLINLGKLIAEIDEYVVHGNIFKQLLNSLVKSNAAVTRNGVLRDETLTVILGWCSQIDNSVNEGWSDCQHQVLSLSALSLFHCQFFNVQEKKLSKSLLSLYRKVPCITVCGHFVWNGELYIKKHFPLFSSMLGQKVCESLQSHRLNFLDQKIKSISADAQYFSSKLSGWVVQLEVASKKSPVKLSIHDLVQRALILLQGLQSAFTVRYNVESILSLHLLFERPMTRSCALSVCRLLEVLKSIQYAFYCNTSMMVETLPHLRQYLSYQVLSLLKNTKLKISTDKAINNQRLDILSAFLIAELVLTGNGTKDRQLIGRIALSLANQSKAFTDEDFASLLSLLKRIALANDLQSRVIEATDAAFIHQYKVIFPAYLEDLFQNPDCVNRIHLMLAAMKDNSYLISKPTIFPERQLLLTKLREGIEDDLKYNLLQNICEAVETDLRLATHSHLPLEVRNPFTSDFKCLYQLVHLSPLNVMGSSIYVKEYVEHYLQRVFYSLTVVAPQDCSTYESMRNLAASLYGLHIVPSHLPSHTVEQVVDVLETVRNIHVFVERYQYNMNQQFFIEVHSNNKHLNTVTIKDISNSIYTHGSGIINTTVNFTYQFLRRKFHILSEFLYDELIKSPLLKNLQHWREVKKSHKSFPFERAEKFHRGIRKLGLSAEGLSYLDQFRKLVTHTGNAIGFVRLVRSGGLHCSSGATQFIPDLQKCFSFVDLSQGVDISEETITAASLLDSIINDLTGSFHLDTDYLKIMVDAFAPALQDGKLSHLQNFFLIVPALTINFVENITTSKENLQKKSKNGCTFTDDGFALGVSYLLTTLNQGKTFDSLHWWSSVRGRFISEKEKIEQQRQNKTCDPKLLQTLTLSLSRLIQYQQEFEYLYLSMSSARVFFKGTDYNTKSDTRNL